MSNLKGDLISMKVLMKKWNAICQKGIVVQKMWFTMVDVGKLKDLDLKLRHHNVLINDILQILSVAADDKMIEQNKMLLKKIEEMSKDIKRIEKLAKERKKWEEIVKKLGVEHISQAASCPDDRPWLLIKRNLMKKGLSEDAADKMLNPIRSEISDTQAPQSLPAPPDLKGPDDNLSPIIVPVRPTTPNKSNDQNLKPPSAPPRTPSPKPSPPGVRPPNTVTIRATPKAKAQNIEYNRSRILFVDYSNTRKYHADLNPRQTDSFIRFHNFKTM